MEITLICKHETGQATFPAKRISGHQASERRYNIVDHKVVLEGHHDDVLKADAQELLAMPDGLYRMPTAAEQEQWQKETEKAKQIQENAEKSLEDFLAESSEQGEEQDDSDSSDEEDTEEQEEEPAPTTPPAKRHYSRKKK